MRFPFFHSIRATLVFLVLLAVLPALGIVFFSGYTLRENMIRDAETTVLRQIQVMASHHQQVVENARLLLATLSKAREMQAPDPLGAQLLLEEMLSRNDAYVALALSDPKGRIVAVSPVDAFSSIENEAYFQEARQSMRFAMGSYHLRQGTRSVVVEFAQPVLDRDGGLRGVLVAFFDLNYFGAFSPPPICPRGPCSR